MYPLLCVPGGGLEAIDQCVESAKTNYAEARESRKRLQAAEKKHLIKMALKEATLAVHGLQ